MPRAPSKTAKERRDASMRMDRAAGRTMRQIAEERGVSVALAHKVTRDVHIVLLPAWHRARQPKDEPPPPLLGAIHALLTRRD